MANEQLIDTVILPQTNEQVTELTALLDKLDIQFTNNIKTVNQFNMQLLNAKSFTEYNKNAVQTALGLEKIQAAQNKTALTTLQLEQAKQKAADLETARLAKQEQQRASAQAKQDAADAQQIAAAEKKAAKLKLINDESGFPESKSPGGYITEEPDRPMVAPTDAGDNISAGLAAQTAARETETVAIAEQQAALALLSTEYKANLELLNQLTAERAENTVELKALNLETAEGIERQTYLTAEQLRLKVEIQGVTTELNRQTKEMIAAEGSITELDAKIQLLTTAYEQLSIAERESEEGQKMASELKLLTAESNTLSQAVGNTKKNVGNYTESINKSSAGMAIADRITNQLTRSFIRMAVQMVVITAVLAAVTWVADLIKNMDMLTGRLDETIQKFKALKEALAGGEYAKAIENVETLTEDIRLAKEGFISKKETLDEYNKTFKATLGYAKDLDEAEQNLVKHGNDYIQVTLLKAAAQIALKSAAEASYKAAAIAAQTPQDAEGDVDITSETGFKLRTTPAEHKAALKRMQDADIADKKKEADLQLKIFKDYQDKAAELAKKAGIGFFEKPPTEKKPKDTTNNDLIESGKIDLEEAKKQAKAMLDNQELSFEQRLKGLRDYISASKQIIDKNAEIVKKDTSLRHQQQLNDLKKLNYEKKDLDAEYVSEVARLKKEELATIKSANEKIIDAAKENEQDQLETLENAGKQTIRELTYVRDKKATELFNQRQKDKIDEKKYQEELLALDDSFNIAKITAELTTQRAILALKEKTRDQTIASMKAAGASPDQIAQYTKGANKDIQGTQNTIGDEELQLSGANIKLQQDTGKSENKDADAGKKKVEQILEATTKAIDEVAKLRQKAFEAQVSQLEKLDQIAERNADNEKERVNDSIASDKTKAREIALIDKQLQSQKEATQTQINNEKNKEAKADKEAGIAKIIVDGAASIVKNAGNPILEALAIATVAIELATAVAAPLPHYATGGSWQAGLGLWGESGTERADLPGGMVRYSRGPEITSFPVGTKITPHMELMRQLRPAPIDYVGGERAGWEEILKYMKKRDERPMRNVIRVNVDGSYEQYKRAYLRR